MEGLEGLEPASGFKWPAEEREDGSCKQKLFTVVN